MESGLLHTKEMIILATIEVINEYSVHDFSTREIAKRVGISEPAIFKHFKTKKELLLAVLDHYSVYDKDIIQSIKVKNMDPVDALIYFVDTYTNYYQNYPAITVITQNYDLLRKDPDHSEKIKSIMFSREHFMMELIEQGQRLGRLSSIMDRESLAVMINGLVREWCLSWRFSNYSFSLRDKVMNSLSALLKAFEK